jgi:hypothetical protein
MFYYTLRMLSSAIQSMKNPFRYAIFASAKEGWFCYTRSSAAFRQSLSFSI